MGYFRRDPDFIVKMTKCRLDVHAKWSSDTPSDHVSKLTTVVTSSSDSARVDSGRFSDILNAPGFERFAGDYD